MHRQAPPAAVEALQPDAPPALAALTAAALRKDPAQRPPDGEELLAALGAAPTASVIPADAEATQVIPADTAAPARRLGRGTALVAVALLLLAAGGGVLAWAVTRPNTAGPGLVPSTGSVAGAQKHGHTGSTTATPPTTTAGDHGHHQGKRKRKHKPGTTTGRTTTAATTQTPLPTQTLPSLPTTTLPTTTLPTTTLPSLPTTTLPTTALPTTTVTGTT
jgi:hypothetical protein